MCPGGIIELVPGGGGAEGMSWGGELLSLSRGGDVGVK